MIAVIAVEDAAFLLAPLREGRHQGGGLAEYEEIISTHAPTRGATAIFHKTTS